MNIPYISVIVPIYQAERTLEKCLKSITSQSLKNIEILLVDDGSTDGSGNICDGFAGKDSRIKVFHKDNGGSASARQVGIENMRGDYSIVVDSDDWLEWNALETLFLKAKEGDWDLVYCDFIYNYDNGKSQIVSNIDVNNNLDSFVRALLSQRITGSTCNKLIRSSLIRKYEVSYVNGINLGEDLLFLLKLCEHPLRIIYLPKALYHYRRARNSGSYTNTITLKTLTQLEKVNNWKQQHFSNKGFEKELAMSKVNLAFTALRAKGLSMAECVTFIARNVQRKDLSLLSFTNPKVALVRLSLIWTRGAKLLFSLLYKVVYK